MKFDRLKHEEKMRALYAEYTNPRTGTIIAWAVEEVINPLITALDESNAKLAAAENKIERLRALMA